MKDEWQPISTAPKDGTAILGYDGDSMTVVCYHTSLYSSDSNRWELAVSGYYAEDGIWNPTHWRPLPLPPKDSNE